MTEAKNQLKQEVRVWSLLGPLLLISILSLYLFRFSLHDALFPLLALFGLLTIWRFRMKGLAASLLVLFSLLFYIFPTLAATERFWSVGISMALGLAFVVLALCHEEIEMLLSSFQREGEERFQQLAANDSSLREKELQWSQEKRRLTHDLEWVKSRQELLEKEGERREGELSALAASLKAKEDSETALRETLLMEREKSERELGALSRSIKAKEASEAALQETLAIERGERAKLQHALDTEKELKAQSIKSKEEKVLELQRLLSASKAPLQEEPLIERCSFEPRYRQLRDQFEEKGALLDKTRQELFALSEKKELLEREIVEKETFSEPEESRRLIKQIVMMQREREHMERTLRSEIADLESVIATLAKG